MFQCRNLPASDGNGLADPYVNIYCNGSEVSTKSNPIECTLNPRWYQTLSMPVHVLSVKDSAPIVIYVYDYDKIDSDDVLGVTIVEMSEAYSNNGTAPRPKWKQLSLGRKGTEKGEILISFSIIKPDVTALEFNIIPEFEDKNAEINILGLRDLKPAVGWLPVNKAFVKFDMNSLELPGVSLGISKIETQPFESGSDPNINTSISFKCKMPRDRIFSPMLTATVHDYLFAGLSQPLIGSFALDLASYKKPDKFAQIVLSSALTAKKNVPGDKKKGKIDKKKILPNISEKNEEIEEEEEEKVEDVVDETMEAEANGVQLKKFESNEREVSLTFEEIINDPEKITLPAIFETSAKKTREVRIPNQSQYFTIGYNRTPDDGNKSYRYYIDKPLEETFLFNELPFEQINIIRGQCRGADDSFFSFSKKKDQSGETSTLEVVGKFKAAIRLTEYPPVKQNDEFNELTKLLLTKTTCIIRIYVLDAFDLEQKDVNSMSDPYIRVKLAGKVISERQNHQEDISNPKIYKSFEMSTSLPGKSMLKIQMWDYNSLLSDSKIGTTKIDLEDRFFNKKWVNLQKKPIETRPLYIKSSRRPQGYIRLWLEILSESKDLPPVLDISPRPPSDFEARVII